MRGATSPRLLLLELMCAQILLPAASSGEEALAGPAGTAGTPAGRHGHGGAGPRPRGAAVPACRRAVARPRRRPPRRPDRPARPPAGRRLRRRPAGRPGPPGRNPAGGGETQPGQGPRLLLSNATVHSVEGGVLTVLFAREGDAKGFTSELAATAS